MTQFQQPARRAAPQPSRPQKVRLTIHEIAKETSPRLFVVNKGPALFKQPSVVGFTYRGEDGEPLQIEVENTWIPRDIAELVPKEELLKNTTLRGFISKGILELVRATDAEEILKTPDAIIESDRLEAERIRKGAQSDPTQSSTRDGEFRTLPTAPNNLPPGSKGEFDESLRNVTPAVAECARNEDLADAERRSMLRTLLPTMTLADVEFLRSEDHLAGDADLMALVDSAEADIRANNR